METPKKGSKGGRVAIYDESLKIAVARDYHIGILSMGQVAKKHGIGTETVYHFVRWYKKHIGSLDRTSVPSVDGEDILSLRKALASSDENLRYAEMRITALELLLKNAEKEVGVDLLKKLGTKQ